MAVTPLRKVVCLNPKRNAMKRSIKNARMRNPLHNHPLLRKGGEHRKTNKVLRQQTRQSLRRGWHSLMTVWMTVIRKCHSTQQVVAHSLFYD
jgi:hypothetical protein